MTTPTTPATSQAASEGLKPCPFCGAGCSLEYDRTIFHRQHYPKYPNQQHGYRIECLGGCHAMTCWWHTINEATEAWNRRLALSERPPVPAGQAVGASSLFVANTIVAEQWGVPVMTPFVRLADARTLSALVEAFRKCEDKLASSPTAAAAPAPQPVAYRKWERPLPNTDYECWVYYETPVDGATALFERYWTAAEIDKVNKLADELAFPASAPAAQADALDGAKEDVQDNVTPTGRTLTAKIKSGAQVELRELVEQGIYGYRFTSPSGRKTQIALTDEALAAMLKLRNRVDALAAMNKENSNV